MDVHCQAAQSFNRTRSQVQRVKASRTKCNTNEEEGTKTDTERIWQISKDELDVKSNNEAIVTISCEDDSNRSPSKHQDHVYLNEEYKDVSPVTDYSTDASVECVYLKNNPRVVLPL